MALLVAGLATAGCPSGVPTDALGPPSTGGLTVAVTGLPSGAAAAISVAGPAGYSAQLTGTQHLSGLAPGGYQVTAHPVEHGGTGYAPEVAAQSVGVAGGQTSSAPVRYQPTTGALVITVSGLPSGADAAVLVSGPQGFQALLTTTGTLTGLVPGTYQLVASEVDAGGDSYLPGPASQAIQVPASAQPATATVTYAISTGRLSITLVGVPQGGTPAVQVSGPGGFQSVVAASQTLTGLVPGSYTLTAEPIQVSGNAWSPTPAHQVLTVLASTAAANASIAWAATTGSLTVVSAGLPPAVSASIVLTGPGGFQQTLTGSASLPGLVPGTYQIASSAASAGGLTWQPVPAVQSVLVLAGGAASAGVAWSLQPGALQVTVAGLPGGTNALVTVSGPDDYTASVGASTLLSGLAPGTYTVAALAVDAGGVSWTPVPASQQVVIGSATGSVTVTYVAATGSLAVTVTGLSGPASVAVTGPGGYAASVTATSTLGGLVPGSYQIVAASVVVGGTTWQPTPASQSVSVVAGATAAASVTYTAAPATTFNLRIESAYLTQAVQRPDHGVELVAGRDAYLRVFAVANEANSAQPAVRVRLFHGAAEVQSWTLSSPGPAVPQAMNEGSLASSWNVLVPGSLVVPGLRLQAEVDPAGAIAEQDEGDNLYPTGGGTLPVTVRALQTFQIRLVPVLQTATGLQGDATVGNMEGYLTTLRRQLPIGAYDVDVRTPYTTNAPALQSNNGNGAWGTVLSEVLALRNVTDQSTRYYYGVVRVGYSSGIAGIGYVPGHPASTAKAALGWDHAGSRARVLAHELGHNFGRSHAPCGGAGGPDPNYPHTGGQIGAWGLDVAALSVKAPTTFFDLMGYCPPNEWVSDYTWNAVVAFRSASPTGGPPGEAGFSGEDDGLLVWGRATVAGVVLEPAFRVAPRGPRPAGDGTWRVEGRDAGGLLLFSQPFTPEEVADLPGGPEHQFAMVLPLGAELADRVVSLRVVSPVGTAQQMAGPGSAEPAIDPTLRPVGADRQELVWDAGRHAMALVRDAATGEVLSFARGGAITIWSGGGSVDVQLSDGVRVARRRLGGGGLDR